MGEQERLNLKPTLGGRFVLTQTCHYMVKQRER